MRFNSRSLVQEKIGGGFGIGLFGVMSNRHGFEKFFRFRCTQRDGFAAGQ
jgi:hypothetical protein